MMTARYKRSWMAPDVPVSARARAWECNRTISWVIAGCTRMRTRAVVACGRSIAVPAAHDVASDQVRDHRFACRARRERRWKLGRIHLQRHGVPDHEHRSRRGGERAVAKTEQLTADTRGSVFAL